MDILSSKTIVLLSATAEDSLFSNEEYSAIVEHACQIVLQSADQAEKPLKLLFPNKDVNKIQESYTGLMTLIVEAAKNDLQSDQIELLLDDCNYLPDRKDIFVAIYNGNKNEVRRHLSTFGVDSPRIVDLGWRLDYHLKNNQMYKVNTLNYSISLKQEDGDTIDFQCSKEELQNMISKLKEAAKIMERASQF